LQNKLNTHKTEVIDELGDRHLLDLINMPFLSNYAYKEINKILTTEDNGIDVIYDTKYHTQKNMSDIKTSEYKYPVVHSINKGGLVFWYSNDNTKGHFGVPKVILNKNVIQYYYPEQNDYEGKYGMSQISFGIPISSKREGDLILKAMETHEFKRIIASTKWSAFQTDQRMFKFFKKDWYKILLENDNKSKSKSSTRKSKSKTESKSKSSTRKSKSKTPPVEDMDKTKPRKSMIKLGKKSRKLRRMLLKRREGTRKK